MVKYVLGLLLSTISVLAQLGPHSDQAFLGQFLQQSVPMTNGLLAYWAFNVNAYPYPDSTPNAKGFTHTAGSTLTMVAQGVITNFIRTPTDGALFNTNSGFNTTTGSFTFSGWYRPIYDPSYGDGLWAGRWDDADDAKRSWCMGVSASYANPKFTVRNAANTAISVTNTVSGLGSGAWTHIVVGFDANASQIWIQSNGGTRATAACTEIRSANTQLFLAGPIGAMAGPRTDFDEVGFWTRSLSSNEVSQLYDKGSGWAYPFDAPRAQQVVNDWDSSVVGNGGAALSSNTKTSAVTFVNSLIDSNILWKLLVVNPFASDSLTAALTPMIRNVGSAAWANANFVAGDLSTNGLKGNGSNKYLDAGFDMATFLSTTAFPWGGITLYSIDSGSNNALSVIEIGHRNSANSGQNLFLALNLSGTTYFEFVGLDTSTPQVANSGFGYYSANRTSNTGSSIYRASSAITHNLAASASGASAAITAGSTYVFAVRNSNISGPDLFSPRTLSFAAVHYGLTTNESFALFNAVQTLRTNLGGGYR